MERILNIFKRKKPKFGLTLSGGGARGYAHIGVLRALEEAELKPDFISGTSMGSVIGGAYASGMSLEEIEETAAEMSQSNTFWKYADVNTHQGLFQGQRILDLFDSKIKSKTFAELNIPLTLVAVDINNGEEVHFQTGSVVEAIRASISVPGILAPVERDGMCLVDGGLLNNMPVDAARNMGADVVLAVNVGTNPEDGPSIWQSLSKKRFLERTIGGMIRVMGDSLDLMMYHRYLHQLEKFPPDILIHPQMPGTVGVVSGYDKPNMVIQSGYDATLPVMEELKKALNRD